MKKNLKIEERKKEEAISKTKLFLWIIFIYVIYLLFKTPIDLHNLGLTNIESYYLIDAYSVNNGYKLYKDIFQNKGPLQILFYQIALGLGDFNEFAIVRVRILLSIFTLITLTFLTLSSNLIFKNKIITLLTPFIYIYLPICFKGLWGALDLQGVVLAEGELIFSPFIAISLYLLCRFCFINKNYLLVFFSGLFASLAIVTKLSGASFFLSVIVLGILSLILLKNNSFLKSYMSYCVFIIGAAIPILLQYIVFFLQSSIKDFNFWITVSNIYRINLTLTESLLKNFFPILLLNSTVSILIFAFLVFTLIKSIKNFTQLEMTDQFMILFSLWILITTCAVLSPKIYAAHYYQGLWLSSAIPIAYVISKILNFKNNLIYKITIILFLVFTSWNFKIVKYYSILYNIDLDGILTTNQKYSTNTKEKINKWVNDSTRSPYLILSDLIRWSSKPTDKMYIWPGKSFVYLYSRVKPVTAKQPENFLNWCLTSGANTATQGQLLNTYFLNTKLELTQKQPEFIVDSTPLLDEYNKYSIFKDKSFQDFLKSQYELFQTFKIFNKTENIMLSSDTIYIYKKKNQNT